MGMCQDNKKSFREIGLHFRKKCLNSGVFLFFAFLLYWEPAYLKVQTYWIDKVFDGLNLLVLILIIFFYLLDFKASFFDLLMAGMAGILLASTIFHSGSPANIWKCLKYLWPVGAVCMLTETGMRENPWLVIRSQYAMCFFQIAVNTVTVMFCLSGGLYKGLDGERQFWLGNENVFIVTILAGLCTGYLDVLHRGKRIAWDYLLLGVLSWISVLLVWSATSIIGMTIFFIMLIFSAFMNRRWKALFQLKLYLGVWAAGFFGITIFRLQFLLKPLIVNVLHKNLTFTKRTVLWDLLLKRFLTSPVWGHGVESVNEFSSYLGGDAHWVHAHNYILELMIKGGLALVFVFAALLILTALRVDRYLHRQEARVISICLLSYFVIFIGDCFEMRTLFYMILALAYSCGIFLNPAENMPSAQVENMELRGK